MMLDDTYKPYFLDTLCRLIQIPSRSSPEGGEEGEIQKLMAAEMKKMGVDTRTFEADDIKGFYEHPLCCGPERHYKGRPTVIGEVGNKHAPALLVLAHSDTVQINFPDLTITPTCWSKPAKK